MEKRTRASGIVGTIGWIRMLALYYHLLLKASELLAEGKGEVNESYGLQR